MEQGEEKHVHEWKQRPRGLDLGDSPKLTRNLLILCSVCVLIAAAIILWPDSPSPSYSSREREPWIGWTILGYALVGAFILVVLAILTSLFLRIYQSYHLRQEEIEALRLQNRQIKADQNGIYPLTEQGGKWVNPNAAPAGIIEKDGSMPDPATPAADQAAQQARIMQIVAGAGSLVDRVLDAMGRQPASTYDMPPQIDVIDAPRDDRRLLDAGKEQWTQAQE